ncbi:hypothetical protein Trydic_g7440 [Trypoxylus dichotomus]
MINIGNTQHQIETTGPPVSARARRLSPDKLAAAKLEFQHMVKLGICRPSKSQWSSPLHMVPKRGGSWRPCGDFLALDAITKPVPNLQDFNAELSGMLPKPSKAHPDSKLPLVLMVDASDIAVGASINQIGLSKMETLAFFSKKLTDAQKNYSAYDRELLAAYLAVKHFRFLLEGREFCMYTDHKPLPYAFRQRLDKASPRQFCQLDFISQLTTHIVYIPGRENIVADAYSRIESVQLLSSISLQDIRKAQEKDDELVQLRNSTTISLNFQNLGLPDDNITVDYSTGVLKPYIPLSYRKSIFDSIHNLAHPGINATTKLVRSKYVWPSINKDCRA